jgi:hypothetical protein
MSAHGSAIARAQAENGFFNRSGGYHYTPSPPMTHIEVPEPNNIPEHLNVLGCS